MDFEKKRVLGVEFLEDYRSFKASVQNRKFLIDHLQKKERDKDLDAHRDIVLSLPVLQQVLNDRTRHVVQLLDSIPDGRGKNALYLHYLEDELYKCIAIDMRISDRQLMRDINQAFEQLGDAILKEKGDNHE